MSNMFLVKGVMMSAPQGIVAWT